MSDLLPDVYAALVFCSSEPELGLIPVFEVGNLFFWRIPWVHLLGWYLLVLLFPFWAMAAYRSTSYFGPFWFLGRKAWTFLDDSPVPMIAFSPETEQVLYANEAARDQYQFSGADWKKLKVSGLEGRETQGGAIRNRKAIYAKPGKRSLKMTQRRKNGSEFVAELIMCDTQIGTKKLRLMQVHVLDELISQNEQMRNHAESLQDFSNAMQQVANIATINQEGIIEEVNDNLCKLFAMSRTELVGQRFDVSFTPAYRDLFSKIMSSLNAHRVWKGEIAHVNSRNEVYWTLDHFIPFKRTHDNRFQVVKICYDITERKRSEEAAKRRESYLRSIVDSQSNFMLRLDPAGRMLFVNETFCSHFQYLADSDEFLESDFRDWIHPDEAEALADALNECNLSDQSICNLKLRIGSDSHQVAYTDWEFVGIHNQKGKMVEVQGVGRDITERLAAEARERWQNQQLSEIAFLTSHDLRRPVANLQGLAQLIYDANGVADEKVMSHLEASLEDLDRIVRLMVEKSYQANQGGELWVE